MSYSYREVLPYLFKKSWADDLRCIFSEEQGMFNDEVYDEEYDFYIEKTYSEYGYKPIQVKIPAFKGSHYHTKEEKEFEEKTFNISTKFNKDVLHDSSDGKTSYTKYFQLTDNDTKEVFNLGMYYFSSDYPHLLSIETSEYIEKKKVQKNKNQFFVIEVLKKGYLIHGVFNKYETALDSINSVKENTEMINELLIEEVPSNTIISFNGENKTQFFLNGAIKQYSI